MPEFELSLSTGDHPPLSLPTVSHAEGGGLTPSHHRRSVRYADEVSDSRPFAETPTEHFSDEVRLRHQIKGLADDIRVQLQQATLSATLAKRSKLLPKLEGATSPNATVGGRSSSVTSGGNSLGLTRTLCDTRRMRDGMLAMTTEARHEDFRTIVRKREIRLAEALQEKVSLEAKLEVVKSTMGDIHEQRKDLEALRHNHRLDVAQLRRDYKALSNEIIATSWEETALHNQIQDLLCSLQAMRKKKLPSQLQLLDVLNATNMELSTLESLVSSEREAFDEQFKLKRRHLRHLAEEIARLEAKLLARSQQHHHHHDDHTSPCSRLSSSAPGKRHGDEGDETTPDERRIQAHYLAQTMGNGAAAGPSLSLLSPEARRGGKKSAADAPSPLDMFLKGSNSRRKSSLRSLTASSPS